jgi:hypothetical protein
MRDATELFELSYLTFPVFAHLGRLASLCHAPGRGAEVQTRRRSFRSGSFAQGLGQTPAMRVFNDLWQVVAIHHAAGPTIGKSRTNEGILMSAIRQDLGAHWPGHSK